MPTSVAATLAPLTASGPRRVALEDVVQLVAGYAPAERRDSAVALVRQAYAVALDAHAGQTRRSGESFIQHPLHVALLLAGIHLDAEAIAAGLLHDCVEDTTVDLAAIRQAFGADVAELVDGVTKLATVAVENLDEHQAQNLRKVFLAMARDIRVVLIKLADRLHNVRTAWVYEPVKRERYARETLEIYAPLAGRLGIEEWRWQLEDYAFKLAQPERYRDIARWLLAERQARESVISDVTTQLKERLDGAGLDAFIQSRVKHIYSIERKIRRKGVDISEVYDILAIRILVNTLEDCYTALGVVHGAWRHIPTEFDDYISAPKENGYQSIHTAVLGPDGKPIEVQIRTHAMHRTADYGVAAHWLYKDGGAAGPTEVADKLAWVRQILTLHEDEVSAGAFVEAVKTDFFSDTVFAFTPKGEIRDFPVGSTPLDFAYRIHTDVGHRCIGAKVNGRLVSLDHQLQNGDVVEILTSKSSPGPSRSWLSQVRTAHARDKIRQWFKRTERADNVEAGRALLDRELRKAGHGGLARVADHAWDALASRLGYADAESLFAGVGHGATSAQQVVNRLQLAAAVAPEAAPAPLGVETRAAPAVQPLVRVLGAGNLLTRVAACCKPLPGDDIVGFITRGHGVTVHRRDCSNMRHVEEPERLVSVEWGGPPIAATPDLPVRLAVCCGPKPGSPIVGVVVDHTVEVHRARCKELAHRPGEQAHVRWLEESDQVLPVTIRVTAEDREGLAHDITGIIRDEGLNITAATVATKGREATMRVTVHLASVAALASLLSRLATVRGVLQVARDAARRVERKPL